jgi:GntR family transcriptional regulator
MFHIDPTDATPIYAQLERAIRMEVDAGRLAVGAQLPTVRQLAVDLRINANTVAKVYAELERAGVVETRRGIGTFIRAKPAPEASRRDRERELRALEARFLNDATALGYTLDELIQHLGQRRR